MNKYQSTNALPVHLPLWERANNEYDILNQIHKIQHTRP